MKAHIKDRHNIPDQDYHEVRFEDLDSNPMAVINDIYRGLGIEANEESMVNIARYIEEQKKYQKNTHRLTDSIKRKLMKRWSFALDHWNYKHSNN